MPQKRPSIIAHHLIWTLYGHWLPNDPRGSGSEKIREEKLAPLGPNHPGRKPPSMQPSREKLRNFQQQASPLLEHKKLWIDTEMREIIAKSFGEVVAEQNYTVWACAVLSNHAHMIVRRHRDDALAMWDHFADHSRLRLREDASVDDDHPVWSSRPYKVFLCTPEAVRSCIKYVEQNPEKEGLPPQSYPFVQPYNNWPFHKK